MKLEDARTISATELYDRRKQAILLYKKGNMTQIEIGEVVGIGRNVICEWVKKVEAWRPKGFKTCLFGSTSGNSSDFKLVSRS